MFTGIVEEVGSIERVTQVRDTRVFRIGAQKVLEDLSPDQSISVNGVCLTATRVEGTYFEATAVKETLERSTLDRLKPGGRINLERALRFDGRLGGHFVQGHVDGVGTVLSVTAKGGEKRLEIEMPAALLRYTVEKGSIAVDGVSLTIARLEQNRLMVALIPYTQEHTTLGSIRSGSRVNIEVDVVGKYVERFLKHPRTSQPMDETWLKSLGY